MARTVPSWSWTTWAILASVPTSYSSARVGDVLPVGLALRDQRDRRVVGDGLVERLDRLVAADLEGHDHLREDDRLAQGDEGQRLARPASGSSALAASVWLRSLRLGGHQALLLGGGDGLGLGASRRRRADVGRVRPRSGRSGLCVERLQDADAQALLELEQDAHPGQVDAQVLGQMADPEDPPDVVLRVEADVGGVRAGQTRPSSS